MMEHFVRFQFLTAVLTTIQVFRMNAVSIRIKFLVFRRNVVPPKRREAFFQ